MKLCFPVESFSGLKSPVSHHFGAAPCFVTYDTATKDAGLIYAQDLKSEGSCNPSEELAKMGVEIVITSGIGPGALQRLMDNGVHVFLAKDGLVDKDIENYLNDGLTLMGYDSGKCDCN